MPDSPVPKEPRRIWAWRNLSGDGVYSTVDASGNGYIVTAFVESSYAEGLQVRIAELEGFLSVSNRSRDAIAFANTDLQHESERVAHERDAALTEVANCRGIVRPLQERIDELEGTCGRATNARRRFKRERDEWKQRAETAEAERDKARAREREEFLWRSEAEVSADADAEASERRVRELEEALASAREFVESVDEHRGSTFTSEIDGARKFIDKALVSSSIGGRPDASPEPTQAPRAEAGERCAEVDRESGHRCHKINHAKLPIHAGGHWFAAEGVSTERMAEALVFGSSPAPLAVEDEGEPAGVAEATALTADERARVEAVRDRPTPEQRVKAWVEAGYSEEYARAYVGVDQPAVKESLTPQDEGEPAEPDPRVCTCPADDSGPHHLHGCPARFAHYGDERPASPPPLAQGVEDGDDRYPLGREATMQIRVEQARIERVLADGPQPYSALLDSSTCPTKPLQAIALSGLLGDGGPCVADYEGSDLFVSLRQPARVEPVSATSEPPSVLLARAIRECHWHPSIETISNNYWTPETLASWCLRRIADAGLALSPSPSYDLKAEQNDQ